MAYSFVSWSTWTTFLQQLIELSGRSPALHCAREHVMNLQFGYAQPTIQNNTVYMAYSFKKVYMALKQSGSYESDCNIYEKYM